MFVSEYPHLVVNSKGHLEFGGCDLTTLARKYGTPLYVMNEDIIRENSRRYVKGLKSRYPNSDVAYAGKAFKMCIRDRSAEVRILLPQPVRISGPIV